MMYIFNTKFVEDEYRNWQAVEILGKRGIKYLVKFPDGCKKWVYDKEVEEKTLKYAKPGELYSGLGGSIWKLDKIYEVSEEYAKKNELWYRKRYHAHVVEAPEGYQGAREIDAAYVY